MAYEDGSEDEASIAEVRSYLTAPHAPYMSIASCSFLDRQILSRATTGDGLWVQGEPSAALQRPWPYLCVCDAPTTAPPVELSSVP
jgi:hypothetical protein